MKKLKLAKVIASLLIVASVLSFNSIKTSAKWKSDSTGWWYAEGNSWVTGWKLIDKNWYYFYSNGYMAHDTTIHGYYLNSSGVWISEVPISKEASSLDYLGQEILKNISVENPSFEVKYDGELNNASKAIEDEMAKLRCTNSYEAFNISSYKVQMSSWPYSKTVRVKFDLVYKMTAQMEADLDAKARSIVAKIAPESMSQLKKERAIHDWIVNNTRYDQSYSIYDPYNTLIKHTGVCEGYSLLAQKMFTIAGIKSIVVEGTASGQAHAWNMVYIDNKWYHVDCTWDDPLSSEDILQHDYYNITDKKMMADHSWDTSVYPSAN